MKDDIDHVASWNLSTSIDTSTNLLTMTILVATLLVSKCKTDNESLPAVQWLDTCILRKLTFSARAMGVSVEATSMERAYSSAFLDWTMLTT